MPGPGARAAAAAAGEKTYFTGAPCANGHVAMRLVHGGCVECRANRPRNRDVEHSRNYSRAYREANLEECRRKGRERRAQNPELHTRLCREWRSANPEKAKAAVRSWVERNPDRKRAIKAAWEAANPQNRSVNEQRRRARKLATKNDLTAADVRELSAIQKGRCAICAAKAKLTIDHIIPISRGGEHTRRNVQMLCQSCNSRKCAKDPIEFAREGGLLL